MLETKHKVQGFQFLPRNLVKVNPFKPNGISQSYQLDQSISILRVVWWYFTILVIYIIQIPTEQSVT